MTELERDDIRQLLREIRDAQREQLAGTAGSPSACWSCSSAPSDDRNCSASSTAG
jgi:hypothetical protein